MQTIAGPAIIATEGHSASPLKRTHPIHQSTTSTSSGSSATVFSLPSSAEVRKSLATLLHHGVETQPGTTSQTSQKSQITQTPDARTPGSILVPLSDALTRIPLSFDAAPATPDETSTSPSAIVDHSSGDIGEPEKDIPTIDLPGLTAVFETLTKLADPRADASPAEPITPVAAAVQPIPVQPQSPPTTGDVSSPAAANTPSQPVGVGSSANSLPPQPAATEPSAISPATPTPALQSASETTGLAASPTPSLATSVEATRTASGATNDTNGAHQVTIEPPEQTPDPIPTTHSARPAATAVALEQASTAPAQAERPAPPVSYIDQVSARFIDNFNGRVQRFEIRLDPPELGQVEVSIEIGTDQKVRAVFATSETASLLELMRGARMLETDLARAGIDLADGKALTFRLDRDSSDQGAHSDGRQSDQTRQVSTDSQEDRETPDSLSDLTTVVRRSRTDLHV